MKRRASVTPLRRALRHDSELQAAVVDGLGAVARSHRQYIDTAIRTEFADSINLDSALKSEHPEENRWDYLLGHAPTAQLIAVEPHSAVHDQVRTVIAKRAAAREQLRSHLRDGEKVHTWLWVASGKVQFADTETSRRQLDQNGIQFVGTRVTAKHLPKASAASTSKPSGRQSSAGKAKA
mgnify:FL=1